MAADRLRAAVRKGPIKPGYAVRLWRGFEVSVSRVPLLQVAP